MLFGRTAATLSGTDFLFSIITRLVEQVEVQNGNRIVPVDKIKMVYRKRLRPTWMTQPRDVRPNDWPIGPLPNDLLQAGSCSDQRTV